MTPRQSLAAVFLGALLATSAPANDPKPRLDRHGDPLPEHAIARIGTVRLRHGGPITALAFSPDGKTLASAGEDRTISLWNAADGKERLRIAIDSDNFRALCYHRDGKVLLGWFPNGPVHRWDCSTGKELPLFPDWPKVAHVAALSADGSTIATLHAPPAKEENKPRPAGELNVWDAGSGKLIRHFKGSLAGISFLGLSTDGKKLAAVVTSVSNFGKKDYRIHSTAHIWDTSTGKDLFLGKGPDNPRNLGFARGGKLFFILGIEANFWDLVTGKESPSPLNEKWPRGFVSAGGDSLLACDSSLRIWDLGNGELRKEIKDLYESEMVASFSADERLLATGNDAGVIRLRDSAELKDRLPISDLQEGETQCRIMKDSQSLVVNCGGRSLSVHDDATGFEVRRLRIIKDHSVLDMDSDGKRAIAVNGLNIRLIDVQHGKTIRTLEPTDERTVFPSHSTFSRFSYDGKLVTVWRNNGHDPFITVDDSERGKELRRIDIKLRVNCSGYMRISRDLRMVALHVWGTDSDPEVDSYSLFDLNSGKKYLPIPREEIKADRVEFSQDNRLLVSWWRWDSSPTKESAASRSRTLRIWEIMTMRPSQTIKLTQGALTEVAFRRDGRLVALGQSDGDIVLWDIVTSSERRRLKGHRGPIHSLTFTDDGRKLVSGGSDSSAVIWDVKDLLTPPKPVGPAPTEKQLESFWSDLAGEDAQKGFRAVTTLAGAPEQAILFLQERLKPVTPLPAEQIQKLLTDLNAQRFATRQRAREELVTQGRAIVPALKNALEGEPPLEARRRIEELLAELRDHRPADALRLSRALLALEYIGNNDARKLLQSLSAGAPGAWLTDQAQAALARRVVE